jgi:hypothetical protein
MSILSEAAAKKKKKRRRRKPKTICRVERRKVRGRTVKKKVCRPRRKVKVPVRAPGPSPAAPPVTTPTGALPVPPAAPPPAPDPLVHSGAFGTRQAERLLWRAGFGPAPGQAAALAGLGLEGAVRSLTRPTGGAVLNGPAPSADGDPLAPEDQYAHDHLWWLDRMARTSQPLVERMALIFHDWFGLRRDDVGQMDLVMAHIDLYRTHGLGSFRDLLLAVTKDPAMLLFLSGANSDKNRPNENFGREVMELYTLGADRGAYTEQDIREAARALTGFRADYVDGTGWTNFRYDPGRHDNRTKTIFGQSGNFDWRDVVDLCLRNPYHRSFFVLKLWSYFVPVKPDAATQAALEKLYVDSDHSIGAVVEAILRHPALHTGPPMVKPPAVFSAGLLRARGLPVNTTALMWWCEGAGQRLFNPPNVSGWNDQAWLDTSTLYSRWRLVYEALEQEPLKSDGTYSATETPEEAVAAALAHWGEPALPAETRALLLSVAQQCMTGNPTGTNGRNRRAQRQTALRHLIAACPDLQTC